MARWSLALVLIPTFAYGAACTLDRTGRANPGANLGGMGGVGGAAGSTVDSGPTVGGGPSVGGGASVGGAGGAGGSTTQTGGGGTGGSGGGVVEQKCPDGQFATGFDQGGVLQCAPVDGPARAAFNNNCEVFLTWRDSCGGCTDDPSKWGRASAASCTNGNGTDNTCTAPSLGGVTVRTFGLNTDGGVNDDDKFHVGFRCVTPDDAPTAGPCASGSFLSGVAGSAVECVTAHGVIVDYVRNRCDLYFGWRDTCNGCTDPPTKWGQVDSASCDTGVGTDNTCTMPNLGGDDVHLFGLSPDGDVNGDDKFYVGLQCSGAAVSGGPVAQSCPAGELVVGVNADGTVQCESPETDVEAAIRAGCFVYFGWRNDCDDCTDDPSKWGRVSHNACANGAGADNTCITAQLGAATLSLFGLNTNADVNDNDKFYVGLQCP